MPGLFAIASSSNRRFGLCLCVILATFALQDNANACHPAGEPLTFTVSLDAETQPVSGRIYLMFSRRNPMPINGPNWFGPEPFFGIDVEDVKTGDRIKFDDSALGMHGKLSQMKSGKWNVQAILDHDFFNASAANGPGNFFSKTKTIELADGGERNFELSLNEVIAKKPLEDTDTFKLIQYDSKLLSDFHQRPVYEQAAVVLPPSYNTAAKRRYPVYYIITGFGGTLRSIKQRSARSAPAADGVEYIRVYLTGQCKWGHHVYANSATNGPRGDALNRELIPLIDEKFRTIAKSTARFVGGHSSGGWSSLWLQVTYPDTFGGVWSTAPDPVDFRNWQGSNIYAGESVFFDDAGNKRPLARRGTTPSIWYKDFCTMDDVLGRGGQLKSFEAVFSPRDTNGKPKLCWDRETGKPFPEIVEYWKQYDISLKLKNNWPQLKDKLAGKIHVYMGDTDTFYLEGATILLGERMKELGSDAKVEIFAGKDHSNLLDRKMRSRIRTEMSAKFREHHQVEGTW